MRSRTKIMIALVNGLLFTALVWANAIKPNRINPMIIYISGLVLVIYNLVLTHLDLRFAIRENNQSEISRLKTIRVVFAVLFSMMLIALGIVFTDNYNIPGHNK